MSDRAVVVTGVGFACPQGIGSTEVFERFVEGRNAIRAEVEGWPFATVEDLDAVAVMGSTKEARRTDRIAHMACAAADEAIAHAGVDVEACVPARAGVTLGTSIGGVQTLVEQEAVLHEKGEDRVSPFLVPMIMPNSTAGHISMRFGFRGANMTVSTACASGGHAIGVALDAVRAGRADLILAGGAEVCQTPLTMAGFGNIGALSRTGSRPFDRDRDGFVMGEGAAFLVLEEAESAKRRGARILCELAGFGMAADAHHVTAPHPEGEGAVLAIEAALADARLGVEDVTYVNAHGTSTPLNDVAEARALRRVFGDAVPPTSSVKSMTGHLIGAAGAIEAAVTAMTIAGEVLPPTINHTTPDPEIGIDVVPNEAREAKGIEAAISNSFAFGGQNAVVAFRRF
ncbi:MAG: beta-ketoacyl-ACP synthase II [Acidimicrobiia bacterium]|nr:beta-ketoacyl-ACP synthase II [Acidimicrobiia bacterium]